MIKKFNWNFSDRINNATEWNMVLLEYLATEEEESEKEHNTKEWYMYF